MNKDASKLNNVVPANDLRSENKLWKYLCQELFIQSIACFHII